MLPPPTTRRSRRGRGCVSARQRRPLGAPGRAPLPDERIRNILFERHVFGGKRIWRGRHGRNSIRAEVISSGVVPEPTRIRTRV
jgi:hypothetical protein